MKKIILIIALVSINLYSADKVKCEELFKSAISNFYLENSCKYDKHLSGMITKVFESKNCKRLISDEYMKTLNSEVLGSSYQKMNKVGRDEFCKSNQAKYNELHKIYMK